jgi:NADH-quinone oxidoreductase subunit H
MKGAALPVPIVLALAFACWFAGGGSCVTNAPPQLIQVLEIVPREVEVGDRMAILGGGFPPGKPARVTFRGTLHRPGERPMRHEEIVALATGVAPDRLELVFDEATQALFCGAGERATHTTFVGDVEAAFAAAAPGAAPIAGLLEDVTVDIRPSASPSTRELQRAREGRRALAWMGVQAVAGASGLFVEEVTSGSRAQAAGIAAGDVVTSFDGVRVASLADLVPAPGEHAATLGVRSAGDGARLATQPRDGAVYARERTRVIPMDGFQPPPSADRIGAALVVLIAVVIVWLFGAPLRPAIAAALQRMVTRMRGWSPAGVLSAAREALPPRGPAGIADGAACALLAIMPFGQYMVAARLDVGVLFVTAATSLAAAALVTHRLGWPGARAAAHVAWQHVPAAVAVASVVLTTGSLSVQEIERAQGGWPWEWLAFRSPAALVGLGLLLACSRIEPDSATSGLAGLLDDAGGGAREGPHPWLEAACRAHRVVVAGLASALFLGGWLLPGLSAGQEDAHPALEVAGAVWLLAKTRLLLFAMVGMRRVLPRWRLGPSTRATGLWLAPLALSALAGTIAWTWWSPPPAEQLLVSLSLVAAVGLTGVALGHRIRHGLISAGGDGHLSPFL